MSRWIISLFFLKVNTIPFIRLTDSSHNLSPVAPSKKSKPSLKKLKNQL